MPTNTIRITDEIPSTLPSSFEFLSPNETRGWQTLEQVPFDRCKQIANWDGLPLYRLKGTPDRVENYAVPMYLRLKNQTDAETKLLYSNDLHGKDKRLIIVLKYPWNSQRPLSAEISLDRPIECCYSPLFPCNLLKIEKAVQSALQGLQIAEHKSS